MRRLTSTSLLVLCLLAGGTAAESAPASAAPTNVTASVSTIPASHGAQTVALGSSVRQHQAVQDLGKRRYRNRRYSGVRTHRRSFLSRIFGFIGFLLCLPVLLVLVIALVFMLRRNRRRREEEMMMMRQDQFDRYQR